MMRVEPLKESGLKAGAVRAPARAPGWVVPAVKTALVGTDAALAVGVFVAAYALREGGRLLAGFHIERGFAWERDFEPYAALLWFVVPVRLVSNAYYDLYRLRG